MFAHPGCLVSIAAAIAVCACSAGSEEAPANASTGLAVSDSATDDDVARRAAANAAMIDYRQSLPRDAATAEALPVGASPTEPAAADRGVPCAADKGAEGSAC